MAVFRVERTKNYTVMSNYHLKDQRLSLKAKGLLSQMLSLPDDWDYTLSGLSHINKESKDAIRTAIKELEATGYVIRHQTTDATGKFGANEYIIYEHPVIKPSPDVLSSDNPSSDCPSSDCPTQLNIQKSNTKGSNTDRLNTDSHPSSKTDSVQSWNEGPTDTMCLEDIRTYREMILKNIDYDILKTRFETYLEDLNEIVELMVETVCAKREYTRVAGSNFPHEIVKARFLKLNSEHISFVMQCMHENTTRIRNIKQYLLTTLFNAPTTISNYYNSLVNHDLYGNP